MRNNSRIKMYYDLFRLYNKLNRINILECNKENKFY